MAQQERRPSFNRQISYPFQSIKVKSVIPFPKYKVPNLSNVPHSFKEGKFKCIKFKGEEQNAHSKKYSEIKKCVSCNYRN